MGQLSVLVVEDSAAQRQFTMDLCCAVGATEVEGAENGRVALDMIDEREHDYDILICDLEMPDLNGIEMINLLASRQTHSALIIVSGREQSLISAVELMARTAGLWVLGGVQKPLTEALLKQQMEDYFRQASQSISTDTTKNSKSVPLEELEQALDEGNFVLHYQPKMSMQTGKLSGVEALVRLRRGERDIIFPGDFIPQCEQNGLIDRLSYEVVQLAATQQQRWMELGLDTKVSVNLSAVSFDNDQFSQDVLDLIQQSKIDTEHMIFEVTESEVITDMAKALSILTRLRLSGCGLSIDDFGTGHSSVKQLTQIPFTELKVDRSLIEGIASKKHLQVIFESTLSMCNKLGLSIVAEGIEKKEDWDYLKRNGCHVGQGYYYAPPMPESDLLGWWQAGMPALT
ncbi:Protein YhjK [Saliniradius amylolyticus]|uniref:Protein YhjK n=1 Tax=Saliniradius amylolyticus TaxID=2183582 RepID=A0A2S2E690_9ALTE|nr:EAL domain-containing response regulator [Saliniradius amylolyticus]AWL13119.1 Protein YhjK [Saliniradius amylolyticus]